LLLGAGITIAVAVAGYVLFGSRWRDAFVIHWVRSGVELLATIAVMLVVTFLAVSLVASVLVYEDVGTMVLGFAAVIVGFQLIGRIGTWRWTVWDGRERVAVRAAKPTMPVAKSYPPLFRILAQMVLLVSAVLIALAAVVAGSTDLTLAAVAVAGLAALLGVAVDVMDVARGDRRDPGDAMARGQNRL
jgi:hypothetical protein